VKEIRVLERRGHKLADDVEACLACLKRALIAAHQGKEEQGYGVIRIEEDSNETVAIQKLRTEGFEVVGASRAHASYS
jgi:hypothetical protein